MALDMKKRQERPAERPERSASSELSSSPLHGADISIPTETVYSVRIPSRLQRQISAQLVKDPNIPAVLGISVGKQEFDNGMFKETLKKLRELGFVKFTIVVGDTLQRHTQYLLERVTNPEGAAAMTPESFTRTTREKGKEWVRGATPDLNEIVGYGNYEIIHWEAIAPLSSKIPKSQHKSQEGVYEQFVELQTKYYELYDSDVAFRKAVDKAISSYIKGPLKSQISEVASEEDGASYESLSNQSDSEDGALQNYGTSDQREISKHYIIEETAAYDLLCLNFLAKGTFPRYSIYPGSMPSIDYARKYAFGILTNSDGNTIYPFRPVHISITSEIRPKLSADIAASQPSPDVIEEAVVPKLAPSIGKLGIFAMQPKAPINPDNRRLFALLEDAYATFGEAVLDPKFNAFIALACSALVVTTAPGTEQGTSSSAQPPAL